MNTQYADELTANEIVDQAFHGIAKRLDAISNEQEVKISDIDVLIPELLKLCKHASELQLSMMQRHYETYSVTSSLGQDPYFSRFLQKTKWRVEDLTETLNRKIIHDLLDIERNAQSSDYRALAKMDKNHETSTARDNILRKINQIETCKNDIQILNFLYNQYNNTRNCIHVISMKIDQCDIDDKDTAYTLANQLYNTLISIINIFKEHIIPETLELPDVNFKAVLSDKFFEKKITFYNKNFLPGKSIKSQIDMLQNAADISSQVNGIIDNLSKPFSKIIHG